MLSHVAIYNDKLVVSNPTDELRSFVKEQLSYTDKSKQYQLRRMSKNIWQKSSPLYAQLLKEVKGQLYEEVDDKIMMSSCFVELLRPMFNCQSILDMRGQTGLKISLPWITKPYDLRDYQEEAVTLMFNN